MDESLLLKMQHYFEDDLTNDEMVQLEELLASDSDALVHFVATCRIDSMLSDQLTERRRADHAKSRLAEEAVVVIEVESTTLSRRNKRYDSIHWQRHRIRFNAMTAVLTALAWVGFSYFVSYSTTPDGFRPNHTGSIQYVAEITGQYEHRWAEGMPPMFVRHALLSGERLNLAGGFVEITFDDGAVVVLEGPTEFLVDSSGAGTLDAGKLIARGHDGFSISTPSANFIDLGTEFGAWVDEDGVAELYVFDGKVRAEMIDATGHVLGAVTLVEDEAVQIDGRRKRITAITLQPDIFAHTVSVERAMRLGQASQSIISTELPVGGSDANAAIIDEDFSGLGTLVAGLQTIDDSEVTGATLDRWIVRASGNRWGISGGIAESLSAYARAQRGMTYFTLDPTTGPLDFSFDYRLHDSGETTNYPANDGMPPELRWSVFAFTSTTWSGVIANDGNDSNTLAGLDTAVADTAVTLLGSGLFTAEQTSFASVNPAISNAPAGTVMYAIRFDGWNIFPSGTSDYMEIDNVILTSVVPDPIEVPRRRSE